ncbi:MAG: DnaJ domain-containing protein [Oligoflexia bacterium]|nr:DnaJ domain-containing protein [Oligoflexia bacterium]
MVFLILNITIALSLIDILLRPKEATLSTLILLVFLLKAHAEHIAKRFLSSKVNKNASYQREENYFDNIRIPDDCKPKAAVIPITARKNSLNTKKVHRHHVKARPKFSLPKFYGTPTETLGISSNAKTQTILSAFRHWIKKHHPDTASTEEEKKISNQKSILLTEAKKAALLNRKKQKQKVS